MKNKRPTLDDVAKRAGVSKSAAAAIFVQKQSTVRVSPETRSRILLAAQEMNYRPNAVATSLRRQSTNTIGYYTGYVTVDLRVPFHNHLLNGIRQACDEQKRHLLLQGTFPDTPIEQIYNDLTDGKIDGLILHSHAGHPILDYLRQDRLPVISIAEKLAGFSAVTIDDAGGSNSIAEHLHALGHRHILYRAPGDVHTTSQRYPQFMTMASELGMEVVRDSHLGSFGEVSAMEEELLRSGGRSHPTAIVCWNDLFAHQFMRHCKKNGIKIPDDLAVTGFDGYAPHPFFEAAPAYELTTIRVPWVEIGRIAAQLLLKQIGGAEIPLETLVPVEFVCGTTS
ncbi:MAG: LacI family DNA-binding transcriptional regulator [Capsulimonas sp.]|uniref:LacI family DNA-binding transcriptional regulator n=1 Tax=Capsulimonas sp. TaxID=2494211 RepID=UPI0032677D36